jgi:hypothetical protein
MPSKDELNLMYTNLKVNGMGGFTNNVFYYSSSEADHEYAHAMFFGAVSGYWELATKSYPQRVRAIRAF